MIDIDFFDIETRQTFKPLTSRFIPMFGHRTNGRILMIVVSWNDVRRRMYVDVRNRAPDPNLGILSTRDIQ